MTWPSIRVESDVLYVLAVRTTASASGTLADGSPVGPGSVGLKHAYLREVTVFMFTRIQR